jgi:hypothetical protein
LPSKIAVSMTKSPPSAGGCAITSLARMTISASFPRGQRAAALVLEDRVGAVAGIFVDQLAHRQLLVRDGRMWEAVQGHEHSAARVQRRDGPVAAERGAAAGVLMLFQGKRRVVPDVSPPRRRPLRVFIPPACDG